MKFNHNRLLKSLIDKNMKKKDFINKIGYLLLQFSKMLKWDALSLTIIRKICKELGIDIGNLICIEKIIKEDE